MEKFGTDILEKRRDKLIENLSDIGPGLLFDRTDKVLQEQQEAKIGNEERGFNDNSIMTISKYEAEIAQQSQHIVESNKTLKPFIDKIEDLNNQLVLELQQRQHKTEYYDDTSAC